MLDIPGRAVERLERSYTIEEGGIPRRWRDRETRGRRRGPRRAPPGEDYEYWTLDELYDRAAELRIEGFREMSREEVFDAIRDRTSYEEWSDAELHLRAADLGIEARATMRRDELTDEVRRRESRAQPARPPIQEEQTKKEDDLERLSRRRSRSAPMRPASRTPVR